MLRKFRPLLTLLALITAVTLLTQCEKDKKEPYRFTFQFLTEQYKPLNYLENDTLKGLAPDVLREVCTGLNIPFEYELLPWEDGYARVQNMPNAVLFSTILNATRKDLFKWAGPIASLNWLFYSKSGSQIGITSIEEAKSVEKIGVLRDYAITQSLISQGFENLVYCADNVDAFSRLLSGEIDLFPSDKITAEAALQALGKTIYAVSEELVIRTDLIYFAFNKSIPDDVVADFQGEIDRIKDNGTLKSLTRQYLNSSDFPGTLQLITEQYPPLTFRNSFGEITGYGSDVAYEIMKRNRVTADVRLTLWSIGYELALYNPNVCLFTMDRTETRENLFQWVGPIGTNTTWFYTRAGSGITIKSLDEARNLERVGVISSWFSGQRLQELGFTNLVAGREPAIMAKKLMAGDIDAFVCTGVTFPDILRDAGYTYNEVVPSFALMASDYYIAFSLGTPKSTVDSWQSAFNAMKTDGTLNAISLKWLK